MKTQLETLTESRENLLQGVEHIIWVGSRPDQRVKLTEQPVNEAQKIATHLQEILTMPARVTPNTEIIITKEYVPVQEGGDRESLGTGIENSNAWQEELVRYMRKKRQMGAQRAFKESTHKRGEFVRHVFVSDFQIPDQNNEAIKSLHKFLRDFAPDKLHIVGDFLNFTGISKYDPDPYYDISIADEIEIGKVVLDELIESTRESNPKAEVIWYAGNHENRLIKFLGRNANQLAALNIDGEHVVSIPHLFQLKQRGVQWVEYYEEHREEGDVLVEHGDIVRAGGGMTARAMLNKRGKSGFSGHTQRLALVMQTQSENTKYWVELGGMCKTNYDSPFVRSPDWQGGFAVGIYSKSTGVMHPTAIPILKNTFTFGDKLYKP